MKTKLSLVVAAASLLAAFSAHAQTVIASWTFETSIPLTGGPLSPEVGSGTATSNTAGTFSNPAGWGSVESWSSNNWNVGEYFQFVVSTVGQQNIVVSFQQTGSNTGPGEWALQYSTDGLAFTSGGSYTVTNDGWNTTATPVASEKSINLTSITAINNQVSVYLRLVQTSTVAVNLGAVAATGTSRIDNFTVTAIPEPSTYAAIGGALALAGAVVLRRRRA